MNKYLIPLVWSSLKVITIAAMTTAANPTELVLLNTTPRHERKRNEFSYTLYRRHRGTSQHGQLKAPILDREDLGHIIFRQLDDSTALLIGPFPTSPNDNQLLLTIAIEQAHTLGFKTLHTSPLHAREKPTRAAIIFGKQGFAFDPRYLVYRLIKSTD